MILRSRMSLLVFGLLAAGSITSAWALPEAAWDGVNSPSRIQGGLSAHYETGPLTSAHVPNNMMPYDDTYWPSNRGGIAYRWNGNVWENPYLVELAVRYSVVMPNAAQRVAMDSSALAVLAELEHMTLEERRGIVARANAVFKYHSPTKAELANKEIWTEARLATLSPTEKYDLAQGKYDYPMTHEVLGSKSVNPHRAYWEGICHGWAPASVNHAEPLPVKFTNPDGIVVPFGSADIKAILDYMYSGSHSGSVLGFLHIGGSSTAVSMMGRRCDTDLTRNPNGGGTACMGVNAGAFHIVMTNFIGKQHRPFVADVAHGKEIWNNPVYAYEFKEDKSAQTGAVAGSAAGTVRRVKVSTTIRYPSDDQRLSPQWLPTVGAEEKLVPETEGPLADPASFDAVYRYEEGKYEYWLELDRNDNIVGGQWISQERPDYVWMMNKKNFEGSFEFLKNIYRPAFTR